MTQIHNKLDKYDIHGVIRIQSNIAGVIACMHNVELPLK